MNIWGNLKVQRQRLHVGSLRANPPKIGFGQVKVMTEFV
jgi:hypothetical protein